MASTSWPAASRAFTMPRRKFQMFQEVLITTATRTWAREEGVTYGAKVGPEPDASARLRKVAATFGAVFALPTPMMNVMLPAAGLLALLLAAGPAPAAPPAPVPTPDTDGSADD